MNIFVFGSNLAGRHGRGAALHARKHHGAVLGIGEGPQGNSYAIPTKGFAIRPLALDAIEGHVKRFIAYAKAHPENTFELTPIGTGLAGYEPSQIAPMFRGSPPNVVWPKVFEPWKEA